MQLYALDGKSPVFAAKAVKQKNYFCPECGHLVRVKKGPFKHAHFFHARAPLVCRQSGKSLAHLQIQLHLKSLIAGIVLEKPFPLIGHIADAVWEEEKIIFEVQCSPISKEEAQKRNESYEKLGYKVVWLLHGRFFNKKNLSPAERLLRQGPCYFVKELAVYDQFDVVAANRRLFKGPPLRVDLKKPLEKAPEAHKNFEAVRFRRFSFGGDLLDLTSRQTDISHLLKLERQALRQRRAAWKNLYRLLLYKLLEKVSA